MDIKKGDHLFISSVVLSKVKVQSNGATLRYLAPIDVIKVYVSQVTKYTFKVIELDVIDRLPFKMTFNRKTLLPYESEYKAKYKCHKQIPSHFSKVMQCYDLVTHLFELLEHFQNHGLFAMKGKICRSQNIERVLLINEVTSALLKILPIKSIPKRVQVTNRIWEWVDIEKDPNCEENTQKQL